MLTDRELAAQALRDACALHVLDPQERRMLYQNPLSLELFGELADFAAFEALEDVVLASQRPKLHGVWRLRTRSGPRSFLLRRSDGESDGGGRVLHLLTDITELESGLDDLFRGLQIDPLTNTLNRRTLMYALVRELCRAEREGAPLQLMLVALDGMEGIDRDYGDGVGDLMLAHVGDLIASSIRPTDILGRCEDDCFALVLAATDSAGGRWVAERTRRLVESARFEVDGRRLAINIGIGIAGFEERDTPDAILGRARDDLEETGSAGRSPEIS